jgi:alkylation response protein AidB-like acyl-CoA dehydrogenase
VISFELSEEQHVAQATIGEFARLVLRPAAREADQSSRVDPATLQAIWSTEIIQAQAIEGDATTGRSPVMNALLLEELAAADATLALAAAVPMAFVQAIADQGSRRQRELLLPLFAGDRFTAAAIALMEPQFQFDVTALATSAERAGDGYLLRGRKSLVPLAGECSHFLVIAQSNGAADAFIIPRDTAGVRVEAAKGTLGLRGLAMADVEFDGVMVPATMRLGEHNGCDVQRIVDAARTSIAAILTGMSRGVLEYCVPYLKERVVHGVPLARKQVIAFRLADMHIEVEAMRWMSWRAASELESKRPATRSAQLAYTYAATQAMSIADEGVQAFGGHGFVRAHPIEMWYRNARSLSVLEGVGGV